MPAESIEHYKKELVRNFNVEFHGRQLDTELILDTLLKHDRVAILTDTINSPDTLAREIMNKKKHTQI